MKFGTIVADPPWQFAVRTERGRTKSPDRHYACMSLDEICALRVIDVAAENSALLFWATWPLLPEALRTVEAWGFTYRTGLPWVKMSRRGAIQMGCGYHVRCCSEVLLIGTRGKGAWPGVGNQPVGVLQHPTGPHSAKPDAQYDIAEKYPGPWLEMFARPDGGLEIPRPLWTRIGNEMTGRSIDADLRLLAETGK